jgi:outer membrane protein assembly factor BamA
MKNKLFLSGDARLYFFSEDTYGLGTNAPEGAVANNIFGLNGYTISNDSLTQPLTFDYVKFHQTASYEVAENLFMGIGYHLDQYNKIRDLRLNESTNYLTSHYLYSNKYGFRQDQYTASGVSANIVYDSRDNAVNAYKGWFANGNLRYNPTQLGSSKESVLALMEVRHFQSLSRTQPRKVLAFWGIANWVVSGDVPYLVLPALGYDQRARSGRGYAAGRFRGQSMLYGEAEYRFPISPNTKILGGVLFANVTTTSNKDTQVKLFDYLRGSYGGGLRVMIDKRTRTNLGLDIAFGKQATGLYIVATEAF